MRRTASLIIPGFCVLGLFLIAFGAAPPPPREASPATPAELIATYGSLADSILAVKSTEAHLVRSILATGHAHAQAALGRAREAIKGGNAAAAREAIESLAAHTAQLGTEGDNAVASIRKRLVEGGHHHNAEGEQKGIYDPGFVIVTRAAKKSFLDASQAIGRLAAAPEAGALEREWTKVEAAWNDLQKGLK